MDDLPCPTLEIGHWTFAGKINDNTYQYLQRTIFRFRFVIGFQSHFENLVL